MLDDSFKNSERLTGELSTSFGNLYECIMLACVCESENLSLCLLKMTIECSGSTNDGNW